MSTFLHGHVRRETYVFDGQSSKTKKKEKKVMKRKGDAGGRKVEKKVVRMCDVFCVAFIFF